MSHYCEISDFDDDLSTAPFLMDYYSVFLGKHPASAVKNTLDFYVVGYSKTCPVFLRNVLFPAAE
jgi:hypothetical protein